MNAIETDHLTKRFRQLKTYRDLALYPLRRSTQRMGPKRPRVDARSVDVRAALSNSMGLGGHNSTVIVRRWDS